MYIESYSPEAAKTLDKLLSEDYYSPEGFSGNLDVFFSWKTGLVKDLTTNFTGVLKSKFNLYKEDEKVLSFLKGIDYHLIMEMNIRTVPGQSGTFDSLVEMFEGISPYMDNVVAETLIPYKTFVAGLLAAPGELNSIMPNTPDTLASDIASGGVQSVSDLITESFSSSESLSSKPYGAVFKSNTDYSNCAGRVHDLVKSANKVDTKAVLKDVREIVDLVETLIKRCKDKSRDAYVISNQMADTIHNLTIHTAKKVDIYAMYRYRLASLAHCFVENEKIIKTKCKDMK